MIARESARLTRLTRALLVLARAGARDELPHLGAVPVAPLLEQVAASLPRRQGVEVGVDCPSRLAIVGDADLLEQALSSVAHERRAAHRAPAASRSAAAARTARS